LLEPRDALAIVCTQPHRAEFWRLVGRLGLNAMAGKGAVTCDRLQIAVATGPTHFYQVEYLEPYRASTMKSTHSVYSGMIFIEIREGRSFSI
jgi:hypothetical protein